jgi:hypothetical protein
LQQKFPEVRSAIVERRDLRFIISCMFRRPAARLHHLNTGRLSPGFSLQAATHSNFLDLG